MYKPRCLSAILPQYFFKKGGAIALTMVALAIVTASVIIVLPHAQPIYAAGNPTLTLNPTSGAYTDRDDQQPISVHGTNYGVNESINIYWKYTGPGTGTLLATATGNSTGSFTVNGIIPNYSPGSYTITAIGQTSNTLAKYKFTIYKPTLALAPLKGSASTTLTLSAF